MPVVLIRRNKPISIPTILQIGYILGVLFSFLMLRFPYII